MTAHPHVALDRLVSVLSLLLAFTTPGLAADGIGLAWEHCPGEPLASQNAAFACNTNTGSHAMVGTFRLSSPPASIVGLDAVLDIASAGATLPSWWEFRYTGSCRTTSASVSLLPHPDDVGCLDWADGQASGGYAFCLSPGADPVSCGLQDGPANTARFRIFTAVAENEPRALIPEQDYFAFMLRMNHSKTVGTGACNGCETPVCIELSLIEVGTLWAQDDRLISTAISPGGNFVTWQGGAGTNCPAATPARNSTWGAVKSLYR